MGLTTSSEDATANFPKGLLCSIFGGEVRSPEIPLKSNLVKCRKVTKDVGVETTPRKLQNYFQQICNVLDKNNDVATMTKVTKKRSRKLETDAQRKEEKQTETQLDNFTVSNINESNWHLQNREPWFVSQWYESINEVRYGISIDTNNTNVMNNLKKFSNESTFGIEDSCKLLIELTFKMKTGEDLTLKFNKWDPRTLGVLTKVTIESTGYLPIIENKTKKGNAEKSLITDFLPMEIQRDPRLVIVEIFSPYTGNFTAVFDVSDKEIVNKLKRFTEEFKGSLYQYRMTLPEENCQIKLNMENPKVVYELIMMRRKYSIDTVKFDPKLILVNLITLHVPEDDEYLTLDISRSIVYGGLFDLANTERKGVELTLPCKGQLVHLHLDVADPKVVNKLRRFALATIVPNAINKLSLITVFFLNTPLGFKPITLDLAESKNVLAICEITQKYPKGENPTYIEIIDDTKQFLTISLDLNNPEIVQSLLRISKAAWFVSINAIQTPYFAVCLPYENRHKTIRVRLKPVIIDEMVKVLDRNCSDYTLLEVVDSRRKCSIIYVDPTLPNIIKKFSEITNAVQILPPASDNALVIYNPTLDKFIDIDLSSPASQKLLLKFQQEYRSSKPLTVIKYYNFSQMMFAFVNVDDRFLNEMELVQSDLGKHIIQQADTRKEYVLKIKKNSSGTNVALKINLADRQMLRELDKLTNSEDWNICTVDAYGYPVKVKIDTDRIFALDKLLSMNDETSRYFVGK